MIKFTPGQRVVCVRKFEEDYCAGCLTGQPELYAVYVIRGLCAIEEAVIGADRSVGLWLEEIVNQVGCVGTEFSFSHAHFRPVQETAAKIFDEIRNNIPPDAKPDDEGLPPVRKRQKERA